MGVLHGASAFLISVLPDANSKGRSGPREGLASGIVVLALGHGKGLVLLAELLQRSLVRRL